MIFAVLWVELLAVSLLWTAMLTVFVTRTLAIVRGVLPVSFVLLGAVCASGYMKYERHFQHISFNYFLSLLLAYWLCASILVWLADEMSQRRGRLALMTLLAAIVTFMTYRQMDSAAQEKFQALDAEASQIMASLTSRSIPETENAARIYEQAFARMRDDQSISGNDSLLDIDDPDFHDPRLIAMFDRQKTTVQLMHEAGSLPDCRFNHDYTVILGNTPFPQLNRLRDAARLLAFHAKFETSNGHIDSAITDVNAIYRASDAMSRYPNSTVEFLVAGGLRALGRNAMESTLPSVKASEELKNLSMRPPYTSALWLQRGSQAEEAFALNVFSSMGDENSPLLNSTAAGHDSHRNSALLASLMRVFVLPGEETGYRNIMQSFRGMAGLSYPQVKESLKALEAESRQAGPFAAIITPAYARVFTEVARDEAGRALDAVALAMTRYRLSHGVFPDSLARLVPEYLDKIPLDPFDGKPLHFVRKSDQWIIYSVGPDGFDDGGISYKETKGNRFDLPFILTFK